MTIRSNSDLKAISHSAFHIDAAIGSEAGALRRRRRLEHTIFLDQCVTHVTGGTNTSIISSYFFSVTCVIFKC